MNTHKTGTREEWLEARLKLLEAEKELTRRSDEVARMRQELPWVRIDKDYRFDTEDGRVPFADLFKGRSQLLVYHFMFGPDYKAGCPSCSSIADSFNGVAIHLAHHDVMFSAVSRAPFDKLQQYKQRMGWTFPWASSFDSDFNYDFQATFTKQQQREGGIRYNYQFEPAWKPEDPEKTALEKISAETKLSDGNNESSVKTAATMTGTDIATYTRERPGMSAFVMEKGDIYHTYSAYSRGLDVLWNMYQWLDRAPLGRNENGIWFRRHDEYNKS